DTNKLYFICAGPMEVPWRCINAVDPEYRKYIVYVSHSKWNQEHSDNPQMTHTLSDIESDFLGDDLYVVKWIDAYDDLTDPHYLPNQNKSNGDNDWNTPEEKWHWLRDSPNPDWQWLYSRNNKSSFDVSDAGMTYWLISGGPNGGDQRGGWPEAKDLFENGLSGNPVANAGPNQTVADLDADGSESVVLNGSASNDNDGSIVSYVWRKGGTQIATGVSPTVTLAVGTHNITLTVTDNDGLTDTDVVTIKVNGLISIPAKIEAEDFSAQSGIQTESTSDVGGGDNIGFISNGDWTEYEINVPQSGSYNVDFRVATETAGGNITILSNGSNVGSVNVSNTSGWQNWTTVSTNVSLTAGVQTIRLAYSGTASFLFNVNWFEFSSVGNQAPIADAGSNQTVTDADNNGSESVTLDGSGSSDSDGSIVSYVWTEGGSQIATGVNPTVSLPVGTHNITLTVTDNDGATDADNMVVNVLAGGCLGLSIPGIIEAEDYTAQNGIQTENTSDVGGGLNVGWINNGDYTEYTVCVEQAGNYTVNARVASAQNGGTINILANGSQVGSVAVSVTGGWQSWNTASTTVSLVEGEQTLRLAFSGGSGFLFNINKVEFVYDDEPSVTYYYITNKSQQKNIRPASNNVNAQVVQAAGNSGGDDQQWIQELTSGGYFYLKNKQTNYYLSMEDTTDGASTVQIAQASLSAKAEWTTNLSPDGTTVYLVNRSSGKHIRPNTGDVGSPIVAQPNTWIGDWTRWTLVDVSTKSAEVENSMIGSSSMQVYPNPASQYFTVQLTNFENATIDVINMQGKTVMQLSNVNQDVSINSQELSNGLYFIKVQDLKSTEVRQLIIR
ncbi:MAG: carbohydrate-binding protein, partial [Bacteroidales bacterium]|nr:carbohydrate-binding protein [Bacteroidales bacterium]